MSLSKNYILKKLGNEYMIIAISKEAVSVTKTFNINETGAIIYKGLEANKSIDEIVEDIKKEFDIDSNTARKDVIEFIEILKKKGIYNE